MHRSTRLKATTLVALVLVLSWASGRAAAAASLWDKISSSGELVCAAIPANPLGSWKLETTGEFVGYEINLCRQIATDLSSAMQKPVKLRLQESSWTTIVIDLQTGRADLWPGMSETPERLKAIDMVGPIYQLAHCAVDRKGLENLKTWTQYSSPSVRIAAITGTSDEKAARELAPKGTLLSFPDMAAATLAVQAGRADTLVTNLLSCLDILTRNPTVFGAVVIPAPKSSLGSSAGFRKDGDGRFGAWLKTWADESRANGTVQKLFYDAMARAGMDTSKLPTGFSF